MSADARYPAWNDKYSMQIIVAIGGGSWREFFKFKEGINANGFHTSLEYMGDIYTGNGSSKREALYSAAFNLIASIQFPDTYVKEKALDILELANGLGAGIRTELIREEKTKNGHVAFYQSDPKVTGDIAGDKRTAKKNLIYKLLQPLWKSLEEKKTREGIGKKPRIAIRTKDVPAERKRQLAANFPQSNFSTRITGSPHESDSMVMKMGQLKVHQQENKVPHPERDVQTPPRPIFSQQQYQPVSGRVIGTYHRLPDPEKREKFLDYYRTPQAVAPDISDREDLQTPVQDDFDEVGSIASGIISRDRFQTPNIEVENENAECTVCTIRRPLSIIKSMNKVFVKCIHTAPICKICALGHIEMLKKRESRFPNQCPLCYYLEFAKHNEKLKGNYRDLLDKVAPGERRGYDPMNPLDEQVTENLTTTQVATSKNISTKWASTDPRISQSASNPLLHNPKHPVRSFKTNIQLQDIRITRPQD